MRSQSKVQMVAAVLFAFCTFSPLAFGRGPDLTFRGTVSKIENTSTVNGTVTIRVVGFDVPIKVDATTDIESHGDSVGLAGLAVNDFVKVAGFFSSSGIVAKEIQILEKEKDTGEFRLRGNITKVSTDSAGTTITLLGVAVLVDANTKIERRGPDGGFTAKDLAVDMQADAQGTEKDGKLVASRVKVGNREDDLIKVRFEGRIISIKTDILVVDTESGGVAEVLKSSSTKVIGTLVVGKMVEVKGTLNSKLQVVADLIKVDGEEEDQDNKGAEVHKEIKLSPSSKDAEIKGKAGIEYKKEEGKVEQEFMVEIEKGNSKTDYKIGVEISSSGTVDFGTLTTDANGKGKVKFTSNPKGDERDINKFLPSGKDVRDFKKVQITLAGKVVLEGSF